MKTAAAYRRWVAGTGMALAAVLTAVAMGTNVPFSGAGQDVLEAMAGAGSRAWLSAITYLFAQLAMIAGALGVAHLLRANAPVLSNVGATLAVLGAFGHTVHGGGVLLTVSMAADQPGRATHAAVLDDSVSSPAGIFSVMGLLGTVLGLVVLAIGIWRVGLGPRWVAPVLGGFIVLEFVGAAVVPLAGWVAGALYLAAFIALALTIWGSPLEAWQLRSEGRDVGAPSPSDTGSGSRAEVGRRSGLHVRMR